MSPVRVNIKKILQVSLLALFFIFIVGYAFFRSQDLIFGVKIKNVNIEDGQKFSESTIVLKGNAKNATVLTLNGREISINLAGDFQESLALLSGINIVNIRAVDKFGHRDEENYQLIYAPQLN